MSELDKFLDMMDGTTVPYVEMTEDAQNPYCDSCSSAIRPNSKVQMYACDRLIDGQRVPRGFRVLRMHCEDCRFTTFHFPHEGTDEYLVDATIDSEWTIHDPELVAVSPASEGIPWDPKQAIEELMMMQYETIQIASGYESQGPLDVVDLIVTVDIDPREVIHDDGSVTVTDAHRRQFAEAGQEIMEEREKGGGPPAVSVFEKLKAYMATEDPDD